MMADGREAAHAALAAWATYYEITGSAAAALTGLQFVVQTLIAQGDVPAPGPAAAESTVAAFGTPTVVHFAAALLTSAGLSAPWPSLAALRVVLGTAGAAGLAYAGVVLRRARRQTSYRPVLEDWVWHVVLPAAAYAGLALAAWWLREPGAGLFVVGATTLLLLCVGIHNAWDSVSYLTARRRSPPAPGGAPGDAPGDA
ncbi:hypothetical protein tb265_09550 [Gemmatimonadetes bacterium T265]|nr:hypothetical protein tb265_09550 [Gemmatimonadetes bacterium T265]